MPYRQFTVSPSVKKELNVIATFIWGLQMIAEGKFMIALFCLKINRQHDHTFTVHTAHSDTLEGIKASWEEGITSPTSSVSAFIIYLLIFLPLNKTSVNVLQLVLATLKIWFCVLEVSLFAAWIVINDSKQRCWCERRRTWLISDHEHFANLLSAVTCLQTAATL